MLDLYRENALLRAEIERLRHQLAVADSCIFMVNHNMQMPQEVVLIPMELVQPSLERHMSRVLN